ncbi:Uncharacterised protein [Algoriella xinjiangensis]|uniref:hypothetical protein n=1 Tax=Algoriella xinjiangensis TaxID=684065 RepID=UPI000F637D43|nr:hypothetical protein [Algoriella xinjiangensis]VDH16146.1 Uncharacterised protein [Algoriella xinjiangensis]
MSENKKQKLSFKKGLMKLTDEVKPSFYSEMILALGIEKRSVDSRLDKGTFSPIEIKTIVQAFKNARVNVKPYEVLK